MSLALVLRVWGLGWGLPSAAHYFSYHPDESIVLLKAMGMSVFGDRLLPHFYNYGSLQLYLVLFANTFVYLFGNGGLLGNNFDFATQHAQWAGMYLVGRWLTVAMGVGTVWAVFAVGTRLWGRRAGWAAALTLAIMPLHAQHSHWLTVDVPATFWGTLSLLWAVRLAQHDPKPLRAALLAGVFAGLAAATKYNLALMVLPLAVAAFQGAAPTGPHPALTRFWGRAAWGPLSGGLLGAAAAFLAACPGAALDAAKFGQDFQAEADHVRFHPEAEFLSTGSGFVYHVAHNLDAGLGLPLLLLCVFSVGYALWRRERGDGLLAAFALPYYLLIGLAAVRYARYTIPLLPVLALWAGRLLADVSRLSHPALRRAGIAVGAAVLLFTLADAVWLVWPMTQPDSRDRALAWLQAHAPAPTPVAFATQPWFDAPPVSPWFCLPQPGTWAAETDPATRARILYTHDWDTDALGQAPVVVETEYGYADALRLHDSAAAQYLGTLRGGYVLAARFERTGLDGQRLNLPHDMAYPSPAIYIYTRK